MKRNQSGLTRDAARGRGRVQRTAWEALVIADGMATTTQVIDHVYVHKRRQLRARLDAVADRVGRSRGPGRPWLWRLRPGCAPPGYWDVMGDDTGRNAEECNNPMITKQNSGELLRRNENQTDQ